MAFQFYDALFFSQVGTGPDGYHQVTADNGTMSTFYPGVKQMYTSRCGIPEDNSTNVIIDIDPNGFTNTETPVTVYAQRIKDRVAHAFDNNYDICWDLESLGDLALPGAVGATDTRIDYILDIFEQIYGIGKSHRPQVQVGFYMHPTGHSYYAPVQYRSNPTDPTYIANYNAWIANMERKNKRWNGAEYVTKNFSDYCDFFTPDMYLFFKDDPYADAYIQETIGRTIDIFSNGKPVIPVIMMHYHNVDHYSGIAFRQNDFANYIKSVKEAGANGLILWGGWGSSYVTSDYKFSTSKNLSQWQSLSNGGFQLTLVNYLSKVLIHDLNFSASHPSGAVSSFSDIASRIQTAINEQLNSNPPRIENYPGNFIDLGTYYFYPFRLGPVTVTWDGTYFVINSAGGESDLQYGVVRPPDTDRRAVNIAPYMDGLAGSIPGGITDMQPAGFISSEITHTLSSRATDEWTAGWGYGAEWQRVFKSAVDNEAAVPQNIDFSIAGGNVRITW